MIGRNAKAKDGAAAPGIAARMARSALAALVLVVVGLIPILGQLVWLLAYVMGVGAVMTRGGKALAVKA
jgi:hypothetical protein